MSNQTSKTISVTLESFLFAVGTNWVPGPPVFLRTGLRFQTSRGGTSALLPYEAAYGEPDAAPLLLPIGQAFRVQACISEKLSGIQEMSAKIRTSQSLAELRLSTGNTNIPYHAFQSRSSFYRGLDKVVTPDVFIPNTTAAPSPSSQAPRTQGASSKRASPEALAKARAAMREAMTNEISTAR